MPDFRIWLLRTFALLPLPLLHLVGAALGMALSLLPLRLRTMVDINLEVCFLDQPRTWRKGLRRGSQDRRLHWRSNGDSKNPRLPEQESQSPRGRRVTREPGAIGQ